MGEERFVIRVRGLPFTADEDQIVDFFNASSIKGGTEGIFFTKNREGRKSGDAYIEMETMKDLKEALKMDKKHMGHRYIEVFEARWSEVEWMIKKNIHKQKKDDDNIEEKEFVPSDYMVRVRGLPFEAGIEELRIFFEGIEVVGVLLCENFSGHKNGSAYVSFNNAEDVEKAMQNNNKNMGYRYLELFETTKRDAEREMNKKEGTFGGPGGAAPGFGRGGRGGGGGPMRGGRGFGRPNPYERPGQYGGGYGNDWGEDYSGGYGGGYNMGPPGPLMGMGGGRGAPRGGGPMRGRGGPMMGGASSFSRGGGGMGPSFSDSGFGSYSDSYGEGGYSAGSAAKGWGASSGGYGGASGGYGGASGGYGGASGTASAGWGSSGGYGAASGGYGAASSGYGAASSGYGAASGGYGAASGGYGGASGGYGDASGGYGAASGGGGYGTSFFNKKSRQFCVQMRGVPFNATARDISDFFALVATVVDVEIDYNDTGRPSGTASALFGSEEDAKAAMMMNRTVMWPERFEDPISDLKELKRIKGSTEYQRKVAVPLKAALKDVSFAYFQDPLLLKFTKMVQLHSDGLRGEMIMLKTYEIIKSIQLKKGKGVETDPSIIIKQAIENARPYLILEKVRVGGVQYRVPAPITETRSYFEGMRWIHHSARDERGNPRWIARKKNPDEPMILQKIRIQNVNPRSNSLRLMKRLMSSNEPKTKADKPQSQPRVFSGIQPTGTVHLGNYLGAVKRWGEELSVENRLNKIYCVVDLHAITLPQDPKTLRSGIKKMTASLVACGLDPDKCILFQQSTVKEHAELCWILGTVCTVPRLAQLTQYKEKSAKLKEVLLGLYLYPVLQSADILLYKATDIPVGEDNIQNIQIAQHLTKNFNLMYGNYFPKPKAILPDSNNARVRSLRNPEKKMSKSDPDTKSCIYIDDEPDIIRDKIKKSVTDTIKEIRYDPENRPGVANLMLIQASLSNQTPEQVEQFILENDMNKVKFKEMVTDSLIQHLSPIRAEMNRLLKDEIYLDSILKQGEESARDIASQTITDVKKLVGFH